MTEASVVLDACALIAFFNDEEGSDVVSRILTESPTVLIAAVNVLEVAYDAIKVTGDQASALQVLEAVNRLPCVVRWDLQESTLLVAAEFKANYRISLADSIALALAKTEGAILVSSDRHEFSPIESANDARILWIR